MIGEQDEAMIPEISHFVEDLLAHIVLRGDDRLDGFLTDLLENLILPLVEEVVRVGALDRIQAAILDDIVELVEDDGQGLLLLRRHDGNALVVLLRMQTTSAEAGICPRMAGDTALVDAHEQRIAVAVIGDLLDLLNIAGLLPFLPETLAAAAVEPRQPRLDGLFQGLLVHVGEHEHLSALLLHNGGHQPLFIKMNLGNVYAHQNRTSTPRDLRYSLTSRTVNVP